MTVARTSQVVVETLSNVSAKSRVSQAVMEVLSSSGIYQRGAATTNTGGNPSVTVNFPTGVSNGDVIIVGASWTNALSGGFLPAGWTVLFADALCIIGYKVYDVSDGSSVTINSGGTSSYMTAGCIAYAGCDTDAPIDAFDYYNSDNSQSSQWSTTKYRTPSLNPRYMGGQLVSMSLYRGSSSGASTFTWNGGLTQQLLQNYGPGIAIGDKALVDGTPTGVIDNVWTNRTRHLGMGIVLKAKNAKGATLASPRPVIAGLVHTDSPSGAAAHTVDLTYLGVKDGDIVIACIGSAPTLTTPAGYTLVEGVSGQGGIYSHVWHTGDTLTPAWTKGGSGYTSSDAILLRGSGSNAGAVYLDTSGSGQGSSSSATAPSLTPASAEDLLLAFAYTGQQTGGTAWTAVPSMTIEVAQTYGPNTLFGWTYPSPNPSGAQTATLQFGGMVTLASALLYRVAAAYAPPAADKANFDFSKTYSPPAGNNTLFSFVRQGPAELVDQSLYQRPMTVAGSAKVKAGTKKFGNSALDLTTPDAASGIKIVDNLNDFVFGANQPFTIELWAYITTSVVDWYAMTAQWKDFGPGNFWFGLAATGFLGFYTDPVYVEAPYTPTVNAWTHFAVDRDVSNVIRSYANGNVIASATNGSALSSSSLPLVIGNDAGGGRRFPGLIDEVRISKVHRYGAAGGFTPPSNPHVPDKDTLLLTHFDLAALAGKLFMGKPPSWMRGSRMGNSFKR